MKRLYDVLKKSDLDVICLALLVYFISSLIFAANQLPDYDAYESIYDLGGANFLIAGKDLFFVFLVLVSNYFSLSYEEFRIVLEIISLSALIYGVYLASKFSISTRVAKKIQKKNHIATLLIFFSVLLFALEFYSIRIRAGLSISLFLLAYVLWLTRRVVKYSAVFSVAAYLISFASHMETAVILSWLLIAPLIYVRVARCVAEVSKLKLSFAFFVFLSFSLSIIYLLYISDLSSIRGEHLNSSVNLFRIICLSIVPLFFLISGYAGDSTSIEVGVKNKLNFSIESEEHNGGFNTDGWVTLVSSNYIGLSMALLLLYFLDFVETSGEAMVRIFTLNYAAFFLVISIGRSKLQYMWIFLAVSNALFFINTLMAGL